MEVSPTNTWKQQAWLPQSAFWFRALPLSYYLSKITSTRKLIKCRRTRHKFTPFYFILSKLTHQARTKFEMSLTAELSDFYDKFHHSSPSELRETKTTIGSLNESYKVTFNNNQANKSSTSLIHAINTAGNSVSSASLPAYGLLFISFYHGFWCLFCNIKFCALENPLPELKKTKVTLVAVSLRSQREF